MKKILAISGGIDSMVMLHMFKNDPDVVVTHFNHGTRASSDADESFCSRQAAIYHRPFYSQKVTLGQDVSEEKARTARYTFLNHLAQTLSGQIYTAHHADDLIESIAINLLRGTGWRGLTPLSLHHHPFLEPSPRDVPCSCPNAKRSQCADCIPFIWYKSDILRYAANHNIAFRHDPTNTSNHYLRNRLRHPLYTGSDPVYKENMLLLWTKQKNIRQQIETIISSALTDNNIYPRQLFIDLPDEIALEFLYLAAKYANIKLTRPQLTDFLTAIRTYQPNKHFNLPNDRLVKIKTIIGLSQN